MPLGSFIHPYSGVWWKAGLYFSRFVVSNVSDSFMSFQQAFSLASRREERFCVVTMLSITWRPLNEARSSGTK